MQVKKHTLFTFFTCTRGFQFTTDHWNLETMKDETFLKSLTSRYKVEVVVSMKSKIGKRFSSELGKKGA